MPFDVRVTGSAEPDAILGQLQTRPGNQRSRLSTRTDNEEGRFLHEVLPLGRDLFER
nr:hypothetical protein [Nocardia otitidiscaviarum]